MFRFFIGNIVKTHVVSLMFSDDIKLQIHKITRKFILINCDDKSIQRLGLRYCRYFFSYFARGSFRKRLREPVFKPYEPPRAS